MVTPIYSRQKRNSGVRRPRNFSSMGRKLLPAMIWYLPDPKIFRCSQMMHAAVTTSTEASTVPVRMESKLPALWWMRS